MLKNKTQQDWKIYLNTELPILTRILNEHKYTLHEKQPHTKGERFLMQAITTTGGKKMILYGHDEQKNKVVIKATRDKAGKKELAEERMRRALLHKINFAYDIFHSPKELLHLEKEGFIITITEFIEQTSTFLERSLADQFSFCLVALKSQERAHATTAKHIKDIRNIFNYRTSTNYLKIHTGFIQFLEKNNTPSTILNDLKTTKELLQKQSERVDQYCGFLTHTDFVPHNFRIRDKTLYLLDLSSLQFGNKHESWARLLNFMTLYNPALENLLITYVEENRAPEERESLQLMRLFRLGEIITYYVKNTAQSNGDLHKLNKHRIIFWGEVLSSELKNKRVSKETVEKYKVLRNTLRSQEEKDRQIGLH